MMVCRHRRKRRHGTGRLVLLAQRWLDGLMRVPRIECGSVRVISKRDVQVHDLSLDMLDGGLLAMSGLSPQIDLRRFA